MMRRRTTGFAQSGAVLIVALVLLLLLSLLAASASRAVLLGEKMVAGSQEQAIALAAAEAAAREAEHWLAGLAPEARPETRENCRDAASRCQAWVVPADAGAGPSIWNLGANGAARYRDADTRWWSQHGVAFGSIGGRGLPLVAQQPRFVIEDLGSRNASGSLVLDAAASRQHYYRITARGTARGEQAIAIVQVVYGRTY